MPLVIPTKRSAWRNLIDVSTSLDMTAGDDKRHSGTFASFINYYTQMKDLLLFSAILLGQALLLWLTNLLYRLLRHYLQGRGSWRLKSIVVQDYELLDTARQVKLLTWTASFLRYVLMALQLAFSVPLLFTIFPETRRFAYRLFGDIWRPVSDVLKDIADYLPNLLVVFLIVYAVRTLVRLLRYLAGEVKAERLKLRGFYPDWAMPTYHIVRFLLYAFMVAMLYPYLPGARNGAFQGISVFLGLMVSLGSGTVIANVMAGMVITYMRPFRLGDRIKLNNTVGNVVEKTSLVTRIRTVKNEVVTIPNSFILSQQTINYSESARTYGLIIHTEVTISYATPWRRVHQLLIKAAQATPGVEQEPAPFVLEVKLEDSYPLYQINAYIRDADAQLDIYSALFQNIQDKFRDAGIEILSPRYVNVRTDSPAAAGGGK